MKTKFDQTKWFPALLQINLYAGSSHVRLQISDIILHYGKWRWLTATGEAYHRPLTGGNLNDPKVKMCDGSRLRELSF